jgi:hypothetical protein
MIDDFADRILILRNLAGTRDSPLKAHVFDAELSRQHVSTTLRQKLASANDACIALKESAPPDRRGMSVEQHGHIRSTRLTVELPTGFLGNPNRVDFERDELLGLNNQVLASVEIDPYDDEVRLYGSDGEPIAKIIDFDDAQDIPFEWYDPLAPYGTGWRGDYIHGIPGFEYITADIQFPVSARIYVEEESVVISMTTPAEHEPAIHRLALDIDQDGHRISHRAEWQVTAAGEIPYLNVPDHKFCSPK